MLRQFEMHNCKSPVHGYCEWSKCNFRGEVIICSDYEYYCRHHMNVYVAMHRKNSSHGKVIFLESEIKRLASKLEQAQNDLVVARDKAATDGFKWKLLTG